MASRFRKSIKLAPGIRWNLAGSGSSWTIGPRGASVGFGKRGTFLDTGIPGTGLYSPSQAAGGSEPRPQRPGATTTSYSMTCGIRDDGSLYFAAATGVQISRHLVEVAKKQNLDAIQALIRRKCDEINEQIESLGRLHHDTPDARVEPKFVAPTYGEPEPTMPAPRELGVLDKIFKSRRVRVEAANRRDEEDYRAALTKWRGAKAAFDLAVEQRKSLVEKLIYEDIAAMESFLEESLQDISWPRETTVVVDIQDEGSLVMLDVDLPEIEEMPTRFARVPARGLKLSVRDLPPSKVQRLYAEHVHGILFRLVGEVFAALPKAQTVVASGYSQRRDPATGQLRDDYLLSARVPRARWEAIDFGQLAGIQVSEALARYDLRRAPMMSGSLRTITPHSA